MTAYYVEITVVSPAGVESVLRFSYPAVLPWPPSDPDRAGVSYDPRLIEPANVEAGLYSDMTRGVGEVGGGAVVISDADGAYSFLRGYAVRRIDIRCGAGTEQRWADLVPLLSGGGGVPEFQFGTDGAPRILFPAADARAVLDKALPAGLLGGTNAGAAGYDGEAAAAGARRPLAFGDLTGGNVPLVVVNGRGGAYQAHDGPIDAVTALYVRGGPAGLAARGDYAGAALDGVGLAAAQYATGRDRGLIRAGGSLGGALTADVRGDATGGYVDTIPALLRRIISRRHPAALFGGGFDQPGARAGLWLGQAEDAAADAVDMLCRSCLGWCVPDGAGRWQFGLLDAPSGEPAAALGPDDILSLVPDSFGYPAPLSSVRVRWGRNYAPMGADDVPGSLKEGADAERVAFLTNEWRVAAWESADNAARWGDYAPAVEIDTALRYRADAEALAARWGACFGVPRLSFQAVVPMAPPFWSLGLGDVVRVDYPARSLAGLYRVVRRRLTAPSLHTMTLTLWG